MKLVKACEIVGVLLFGSFISAANAADWKEQLGRELPILGHRNWIVVADSAYPSQTAPGIKTIYAGGSQIDVVQYVLKKVDQARHVRPVVFLDSELPHVPEKHAAGIQDFRESLNRLLGTREVTPLLHEEIIEKLDEAGKTFHVLVIKTDLTLAYTSVFIRLDAGYWSDQAEQDLREIMRRSRVANEEARP